MHAIAIPAEGSTNLVELDLDNQSLITEAGQIITMTQLKFNNQPLLNDVVSLAYLANQLFALADDLPKHEFCVMELLTNFALTKSHLLGLSQTKLTKYS